MTTRTKETQRRRRKTTSLGRVIKLPGDLVVVSRKRLESLLEDFDDLKVAVERLKENPSAWTSSRKGSGSVASYKVIDR